MRARAACVRWLGAVAACAGAATAAVWEPVLLRAGLAAGAVAFGIGAVRAAREFRERQLQILRRLDAHTRVLRNAARAAREEPRQPLQ
ncbi:hypothetical protein [Actinomadura macrotermitis]|uniref:Uncharacterized protein n=1 Tax=Actinomadura macrotermitis TaxID=2585200 RepID=A0A7K0C3N9_9ACTN|nr:hypothetical protein [Actinomadura macrotermitis]MQY08087.1 hypothetical protein [Actinomadura macrotermitis]